MELPIADHHAARLDAVLTPLLRLLEAANERADELERRLAMLEPNDDKPDAPREPARETTAAALAELRARTELREEQDEPAETYSRVRGVVIALELVVCALIVSALCTDELRGYAYQLGVLIAPIALTGMVLLLFGTLDSAEMGTEALRNWRVFYIVTGALVAVLCALDPEYGLAWAVFYLFMNWFLEAYYYGWMTSTMRELMRTRFRGALAERAQQYTSRLLKIAGLQTALAIQGVAHGIDPDDWAHTLAILSFSGSLIGAWFLSTAVFDAGETDPKRAARLRLSFRESAAVISTALYVLAGFAGYILALQDRTNESFDKVVNMVHDAQLVFNVSSAYLVGRLVKAAKTANAAHATDADGGIAMVQHPARTSTGYSSV